MCNSRSLPAPVSDNEHSTKRLNNNILLLLRCNKAALMNWSCSVNWHLLRLMVLLGMSLDHEFSIRKNNPAKTIKEHKCPFERGNDSVQLSYLGRRSDRKAQIPGHTLRAKPRVRTAKTLANFTLSREIRILAVKGKNSAAPEIILVRKRVSTNWK